MDRTFAKSISAQKAHQLVCDLQKYIVEGLSELSAFTEVEWLRNQGVFGGGNRLVADNKQAFNSASVNVSQVHYDSEPQKVLASATALSTIIHPHNPYAPSIHLHFSWTEMKSGEGYWRMMADLNPSMVDAQDKEKFDRSMKKVLGEYFDGAKKNGDRYFSIPVLDRHRGVSHYYIEGHNSGDFDGDHELAANMCRSAFDCYRVIVNERCALNSAPTPESFTVQRNYHTLYLFQVLTLDRGTTSGLMVHDENDVGILGSLPTHVNRDLLKNWVSQLAEPQNHLLDEIIRVFPQDEKEETVAVDTACKKKLAEVVRAHYTKHPEAIKLQASGSTLPPTVKNHK